MSSSNYTYFGPIIKINDNAKILSPLNICSNKNCLNHNIKNNLKANDKFCSECGSVIEIKKIEKNIGNISSIYELCTRIPELEEFEDYLEYPEGNKNTLILTRENIGNHGFYMYSDDFNFKVIEEDFDIRKKIAAFKEEIENNSLKKILDSNLQEGGYKIIYGLINFGDC